MFLKKSIKYCEIEISESLNILISYPDISFNDKKIIMEALKIYKEKKIDFVDALLISYNHTKRYKVHTFDKQLKKLLVHE